MDVVSADHLHLVALAASVPSLLYIMFAIDRVAAFRMRLQDTAPNGHLPALTVFKPICGMEIQSLALISVPFVTRTGKILQFRSSRNDCRVSRA